VIVTREKLIALAGAEIEKRALNRDIVAAYLIGSVASGMPTLQGATDIDLVIIHRKRPPARRELLPLSPDIHLDIFHHSQGLYARPHRLRTHPWLGPSIAEPVLLYDRLLFFQRVQAGVGGQFHRADHVHARAQAFLTRARLAKARLASSPTWLLDYLPILLEGANAAACLTGHPVSGRRMTLILERQLSDLGQAGLFESYQNLLGAQAIRDSDLQEWLIAWEKAFRAASAKSPDLELHPCRQAYLQSAFLAMVAAGRTDAVLWPLLCSWARAIAALETLQLATVHCPAWFRFLDMLLLAPRHAQARSVGLETFLDDVERVLTEWAVERGA
jgi:predicted nucleotidyltransferase